MDMDGMNMPGSSSNSTSDMMMMAYLHITGGDNLFFKSWHPSSNGAIAGACIGLVALSILERFVDGIRNRLEGYWSRRALVLMTGNAGEDNGCCDNSDSDTHTKASTLHHRRTSPPFILAHDLPRGIVHIIQSALSYALMLAVMTFNAAYIISIVLGLGIGEVLFGRWGGHARTVGHC